VKGFDYAPTNSPTLTGNPKSVTPSLSDDDTSIATTAFVKGQNYITSSALTPYLTTADAATTYFTIASAAGKANLSGATFTGDVFVSQSPNTTNIGGGVVGMSSTANSYLLTLSTGGGIPQIFFRGPTGDSTQTVAYPGPAGFLLKADNLSGLADTSTARTNLGLGTMATATAADYSTTTAANGLYYPLSSNPSSYLVAADITGKADLASPTFSGTPSLPTGTIGVTQTAGNNTTALATTAFVTAAVPAVATVTEARTGVNDTKFISSLKLMDTIMYPGFRDWGTRGSSATSGSGSGVTIYSTNLTEILGPNASTSGYAMAIWDLSFSGVGMIGMTRGSNGATRAWNKPIWASGRGHYGFFTNDIYNGTVNSTVRVSVGGKTTGGTGDISVNEPGFGFKFVPGSALIFQVSKGDGSALINVTTSFTPSLKEIFDWKIYSDGAGNVTIYINDIQEATTSNGPVTSSDTYNLYFEMVEQTASASTRIAWISVNPKIYWGN
jgi:hypothetical protein